MVRGGALSVIALCFVNYDVVLINTVNRVFWGGFEA